MLFRGSIALSWLRKHTCITSFAKSTPSVVFPMADSTLYNLCQNNYIASLVPRGGGVQLSFYIQLFDVG